MLYCFLPWLRFCKRVRWALCVLVGMWAMGGAWAAGLPALGESSPLSAAEERALGDSIVRSLYRDPDYLDDPVLGDYVEGLWQALLAAARSRGDIPTELDERFAWKILLGRDRSVNAFALPGGYLGVHLGLLSVVETRDELASVLAHELSHITQRHISRLIAQERRNAPWLLAGVVLGAVAASRSPDAGNALMVGSQALVAQGQLNFSRDMEREADRMGLGMMTQAGFDGQGTVSMFEKLQQATRLNDSGTYPYLRSHPLTTERIADMQARVGFPVHGAAKGNPDLVHGLMAARARVLADHTSRDVLYGWSKGPDDAGPTAHPVDRQAPAWYAAVLSASLLQEPALARRHLERLRSVLAGQGDAVQQILGYLEVDIALTAHDRTPAQRLALGHLVGLPAGSAPAGGMADAAHSRAALALQAQLVRTGAQRSDVEGVLRRLYAWVGTNKDDAGAWQWIAWLQQGLSRPLQAARAEAESCWARFDEQGALDRLRSAQDYVRSNAAQLGPGDLVEAAIIDTRKRDIEERLRQRAPEQGGRNP
ncbi:Zn-dependent protease-like protein [Candidatus Symbiobacter mobilis CR]|uniref:Zn-dependent protease-like protein n=2 Tax=Candidatus Symbiobacter TaxID=1436289 RepID=U5NAG5_9BURK|nr:Zn-dependent protease-like protein [Candidatus Symbiobacter mobilis CR]